MGWLTVPFEPEFMQRALLAGSLAAVASAVIGTWVVVRGLAFIGDALAHGVVPGIAVAVLVGFSPAVGAMGSALVLAGGVSVISRRARVRDDTAIGLWFVGMLALGVVVVSRSDSFATDLTSLLFGDVLGATGADLRLQLGATALVVVGCALLHRAFVALAFDERKAASLGLRPGAAHLAMLVLVAVAIVAAFQAVGALLVFALLVGPPATATLLVRRLGRVMAVAVAIGVASVAVGLLLSYHHGTAAGATIAGTTVLVFLATLAVTEAVAAVRHRSRPAA
jgi:ABC-type Mn2+/Zn2+ transport system permease subunit